MTVWTPVKKGLPEFGELVHVGRSNGARFIGKLTSEHVWLYPMGNFAYHMRPSDKWRPLEKDED